MRLDFILLNQPLRGRLIASGVDSEYRGREKPSDHAPVWVQLRD
jgi:exodeoxyribonuclease-3